MKKSMAENLREHLESLTDEEINQIVEDFRDKRPKGWLSIEDHLPMMDAIDIMNGGSKYKVRYKDGNEGTTMVGDHNTWYYYAKEVGITHWLNE